MAPDGTVRDEFPIPRGYWEAKDTADDLDAEIGKKIAKGYPLTNIIFEDTRTGVLYRNGNEALRVDLADKAQLAELLDAFLAYSEPNIEEFEKAVDEFKERVPELALGLTAKIAEAHRDNKRFIDAFTGFFEMCKTSRNPNLSRAAVDEMFVRRVPTGGRHGQEDPPWRGRFPDVCRTRKRASRPLFRSFPWRSGRTAREQLRCPDQPFEAVRVMTVV